MNAHLLRDIGAPDEMVAHAAAARPPYERSGVPFGFGALPLALLLIGTSMPAADANAAPPSPGSHAQGQVHAATAPMAGVFAGEYVNGAPVYRFPAVVVMGSRKDSPTGNNLQPCRHTRLAGIKSPA